MIEKNPMGNDLRGTLRERGLPEDAVCVLCGESDPVVLEMHHPLGRNHSEGPQVPLCKNDHARCS